MKNILVAIALVTSHLLLSSPAAAKGGETTKQWEQRGQNSANDQDRDAKLQDADPQKAYLELASGNPLDAYIGTVRYAFVICDLTLQRSLIRNQITESEDTNYFTCIDRAKKNVKVRYEAAVKTVKKPAAKTALKDHFVTAMATLTSISPASQEIQMNYTRRQAENLDKLTVKWAKFEVEN